MVAKIGTLYATRIPTFAPFAGVRPSENARPRKSTRSNRGTASFLCWRHLPGVLTSGNKPHANTPLLPIVSFIESLPSIWRDKDTFIVPIFEKF
jgi:hypothetical protein